LGTSFESNWDEIYLEVLFDPLWEELSQLPYDKAAFAYPSLVRRAIGPEDYEAAAKAGWERPVWLSVWVDFHDSTWTKRFMVYLGEYRLMLRHSPGMTAPDAEGSQASWAQLLSRLNTYEKLLDKMRWLPSGVGQNDWNTVFREWAMDHAAKSLCAAGNEGNWIPESQCPPCECPPCECQPPEECQCVPDCQEKQCGDDGCGGYCGQCAAGYACAAGECVLCPAGWSVVNDECVPECPVETDECKAVAPGDWVAHLDCAWTALKYALDTGALSGIDEAIAKVGPLDAVTVYLGLESSLYGTKSVRATGLKKIPGQPFAYEPVEIFLTAMTVDACYDASYVGHVEAAKQILQGQGPGSPAVDAWVMETDAEGNLKHWYPV